MKLLLDINVLLDVLLRRDPWAEPAASLLTRIERGEAEGLVAAHTLTTIHYVVSRARNRQSAATAVTDLLRFLEVVPLEKADFIQALVLPVDDFEDAVQAAAALKIGADYIVTRDVKGFGGLAVPPANSGEVLSLL
jgi:predicted nucleic acid-binding protein